MVAYKIAQGVRAIFQKSRELTNGTSACFSDRLQ
ncbi:protein of unknown function [Azospirillum baldaniorum]|uniref:Uncharacterized protein n=1 Tax=Azospirillum baldaniorum TaxID=1064539 RepID=A0A9P1JRS1_9PROT|nr:protein of unknown function [Azospirillum baldaniorum]